MKKWKGEWNSTNYMVDQLYGKRGTETVDAENKESAKQKIQENVSRRLVGTTMMCRSINVHTITEVKDSGWY